MIVNATRGLAAYARIVCSVTASSCPLSGPSHFTAHAAPLFLVAGTRDMFFSGTPLPLPNDDKLMLVWGHRKDKQGKLSLTAPEGVMLMVCQAWGAFLVTMALLKLVTVFTHTTEGTFLRRNLFVAFAVTDLLIASIFFQHHAMLDDKLGADVMPFVVVFALEGLVYLQDALMRQRKVKVS